MQVEATALDVPVRLVKLCHEQVKLCHELVCLCHELVCTN